MYHLKRLITFKSKSLYLKKSPSIHSLVSDSDLDLKRIHNNQSSRFWPSCLNCSTEAKTPPSFPKKISSLQQTEGESVRFECRVAGSSPIEVSWLKDGEPLKESAEFSMIYDDNTAVLLIHKGLIRHSGEYTCVATNSVGSSSCRAKLTLQGTESVSMLCHMRVIASY